MIAPVGAVGSCEDDREVGASPFVEISGGVIVEGLVEEVVVGLVLDWLGEYTAPESVCRWFDLADTGMTEVRRGRHVLVAHGNVLHEEEEEGQGYVDRSESDRGYRDDMHTAEVHKLAGWEAVAVRSVPMGEEEEAEEEEGVEVERPLLGNDGHHLVHGQDRNMAAL